jgi:hypothetical protein
MAIDNARKSSVCDGLRGSIVKELQRRWKEGRAKDKSVPHRQYYHRCTSILSVEPVMA